MWSSSRTMRVDAPSGPAPPLRAVAPGWLVVLSAALFVVAGCTRSEGTSIRNVAASDSAAASVEPPPTYGLDSLMLAGAFERASELPRLHTLLVARHGEIQAERRFGGPGLDAPANVKSVSKSILSALIGIAIEEGHLEGVEEPIAPYFQQFLGPDEDPRKRDITIEHLLTMRSGLERTSGGNYGRWVTSPHWVRYVVTRPMVADPGEVRHYSTGNTHLLSAILTQASAMSTWAYARERLAEPLGIVLPRWPTDPQGIFFGGNNMLLTPRALVRFGELYRNGGRFEGRQIVPEWWVRASLVPRTHARRPGEGYGYTWFISEVRGYPMFYAWGYGGQFVFVVPDLELTVVTTSDPYASRERSQVRAVREILTRWIVPAAETGRAEGHSVRAARGSDAAEPR